MASNQEKVVCPCCHIDYDANEMVTMPCRHQIKPDCITRWLQVSAHKDCPYCRNPLVYRCGHSLLVNRDLLAKGVAILPRELDGSCPDCKRNPVPNSTCSWWPNPQQRLDLDAESHDAQRHRLLLESTSHMRGFAGLPPFFTQDLDGNELQEGEELQELEEDPRGPRGQEDQQGPDNSQNAQYPPEVQEFVDHMDNIAPGIGASFQGDVDWGDDEDPEEEQEEIIFDRPYDPNEDTEDFDYDDNVVLGQAVAVSIRNLNRDSEPQDVQVRVLQGHQQSHESNQKGSQRGGEQDSLINVGEPEENWIERQEADFKRQVAECSALHKRIRRDMQRQHEKLSRAHEIADARFEMAVIERNEQAERLQADRAANDHEYERHFRILEAERNIALHSHCVETLVRLGEEAMKDAILAVLVKFDIDRIHITRQHSDREQLFAAREMDIIRRFSNECDDITVNLQHHKSNHDMEMRFLGLQLEACERDWRYIHGIQEE